MNLLRNLLRRRKPDIEVKTFEVTDPSAFRVPITGRSLVFRNGGEFGPPMPIIRPIVKYLALLAACCCSLPAITLVAHAGAASTNNTSAATPAVDTSGADFLVVVISGRFGLSNIPTITDSTSGCSSPCNTWHLINSSFRGDTSNGVIVAYASNPTVGPSHTITVSQSNLFPAIFMAAFSIGHAASLYIANNNYTSGATSLSSNSIATNANGELIVSGLSTNQSVSGQSVSNSFTITDTEPGDGAHSFGGGLAYFFQPTSEGISTTWSWTNSVSASADIVGFGQTAPAATSKASMILY